jgi:putative tryptophan/tyrosine transport system substrate-binding protein
MRRRALIVGLLAAPLATIADAQKRPRISILHSGFPNRTPIHLLLEALGALGYEDGSTATIEVLGGEGNADRLSDLIAHLAAQRPDVIIAITSPAVLGLKQAALPTPVVFLFVSEPVELGIVASAAHPGGNFTGITYSEAPLGGKRLELLVDALPGTKRVAVLWSPTHPETAAFLENIRRSALALGIEIFSRELRETLEDLPAAFGAARREGAQAVIFMGSNLTFGYRKEIAELEIANHLPSIHAFVPEVVDGSLMSYGPDMGESYRRSAALADRILRGARPADLPVEEPTRFTLAVNMKTAKALGMTFSQVILARADEVIE